MDFPDTVHIYISDYIHYYVDYYQQIIFVCVHVILSPDLYQIVELISKNTV